MLTNEEFYHSTVTLRREYHLHYRPDGSLAVSQTVYTLNFGPGGRWFCLEGEMDIAALAERIFSSNYRDSKTMQLTVKEWC